MNSELDWVIVRPPALRNGPKMGKYRGGRGDAVGHDELDQPSGCGGFYASAGFVGRVAEEDAFDFHVTGLSVAVYP